MDENIRNKRNKYCIRRLLLSASPSVRVNELRIKRNNRNLPAKSFASRKTLRLHCCFPAHPNRRRRFPNTYFLPHTVRLGSSLSGKVCAVAGVWGRKAGMGKSTPAVPSDEKKGLGRRRDAVRAR